MGYQNPGRKLGRDFDTPSVAFLFLAAPAFDIGGFEGLEDGPRGDGRKVVVDCLALVLYVLAEYLGYYKPGKISLYLCTFSSKFILAYRGDGDGSVMNFVNGNAPMMSLNTFLNFFSTNRLVKNTFSIL